MDFPDVNNDKNDDQKNKLNVKRYYRFRLLERFDKSCKEHGLGISLQTTNGLCTQNPDNSINFWNFRPNSKNKRTRNYRGG